MVEGRACDVLVLFRNVRDPQLRATVGGNDSARRSKAKEQGGCSS